MLDANSGVYDTTGKEIINKKRYQRNLGVHIRPPPGYLQKSVHKDLILLKNGGRLFRQKVSGISGNYSVHMVQTCSVDCVLMCMAMQYKWNQKFSIAINGFETQIRTLIPGIQKISNAKTLKEAMEARFTIMESCLALRQRYFSFMNTKHVYIDMYDSEREVTDMLYRELILSFKTETCSTNGCQKQVRQLQQGVVDITVNMQALRVDTVTACIVNQWSDSEEKTCPE